MNIKRVMNSRRVKDAAYIREESGNSGLYTIWLINLRNKDSQDYLVEQNPIPEGVNNMDDFLEFLESEYNVSWVKSLRADSYIGELSKKSPLCYLLAEFNS